MAANAGLETLIASKEKELQASRRNVGELEGALEESEGLVSALAAALTAAGGDNALVDVANRLKAEKVLS